MRELEDYKWFPKVFRRHQMDFLSMLASRFQLYLPVSDEINTLLDQFRPNQWTDVCSGSGGPVISILLNTDVLLTDLFPPEESIKLPDHITYYPQPVDITKELPPGDGLITMFNSFHHFNLVEQENILRKIGISDRPFLAAEILQPGLFCLFKVILTTTIGHWFLVPLMKPFSFLRLLLTYLIPVHTITVFTDGIISVFKSKNTKYYTALANRATTHNYSFKFKTVKGKYGPLYLLIGNTSGTL
jgi:hypothetical protein